MKSQLQELKRDLEIGTPDRVKLWLEPQKDPSHDELMSLMNVPMYGSPTITTSEWRVANPSDYANATIATLPTDDFVVSRQSAGEFLPSRETAIAADAPIRRIEREERIYMLKTVGWVVLWIIEILALLVSIGLGVDALSNQPFSTLATMTTANRAHGDDGKVYRVPITLPNGKRIKISGHGSTAETIEYGGSIK